jgi:predicted ATPase
LDSGESIGLFADRAAAVRPEFTVTPQNVSTVAAIGARLDGMPLAIELAASRLSGLSVEQLAARLDDRFRLLADGMRTALPRHQTLRALIDWSHQLLTDQERILFRRLAVFAGGCTAEAAEAVCADSMVNARAVLHAPNVLPLLLNLVGKSLVVAEELEGGIRYRMLETIRQYALEQLAAHDEVNVLRRQHARVFLDYVREIAPRTLRESGTPLHFVLGAESEVWTRRIASDHDNLRAALGWCLRDTSDDMMVTTGVQLVQWLNMFWHIHADYAEALEWLMRALPRVDAAHDARTRAQLQMLIANVANAVGDYAHAESAGVEAVALFRQLDAPFELMRALQIRAAQFLHSADQAVALPLIEEWLTIARELGDRRHEAVALFWLGVVATQQGDFARALECHNASLQVIPLPETGTRMAAQFYLAETWWCMGDHARALAQCEQSFAYFREAGFAFGVATVLHRIGDIVLFQGDASRAAQCYAESVAMLYQQNARQRIIWPLAGLATLSAMKGRCFAAVALWAALQAASRLVGMPDAMISYPMYRARIAAVRGSMPAEDAAEAERTGQALNLDQAVAYALSECAVD